MQAVGSTNQAPHPGGKRVLIVCNSYPPEKGGAPNRIYHLASLLHKAGYRVTVITAMPNYPAGAIFPAFRGRLLSKSVEDGITVHRLWMLPSNATNLLRRGASMLSWTLSVLLLGGPRVVLGFYHRVIVSSPPLPAAFTALLLARLGGRRTLLNVSDLWPQTGADLGLVKKGFFYRAMQAMETRLYKMAGSISGQSEEILARVYEVTRKPTFLYRNLQPISPHATLPRPEGIRKVVYAGLLGIAQGLLPLCRNTDFRAAGSELHLYGDGLEKEAIRQYLSEHSDKGIYLHETIVAEEMPALLARYHAALVPLKTTLEGAVPSKIFMALANGLPVLYSGGGEAADLISTHGLGWASPAADYPMLQIQAAALAGLRNNEYNALRQHCLAKAIQHWNKDAQDAAFLQFLQK